MLTTDAQDILVIAIELKGMPEEIREDIKRWIGDKIGEINTGNSSPIKAIHYLD